MESVTDKCSDYSVEFPFLIDEKTIQFIKKSKVCFENIKFNLENWKLSYFIEIIDYFR